MHKNFSLKLGLVCGAFLIRLYAIFYILPFNSVRAGVEYQILVMHLLLGQGWVSDRFGPMLPTAQMPPGLTVLLFICKMISSDYGIVLMQVLQALFAAGCVWILLRMPGVGKSERWVGAGIMAFHPGLILAVKQINDSAINGFFLLAILEESLGAGSGVVIGVLLGLGLLIRPVLLIPVAAVSALKGNVRQWIVMGCIAAVIVSPWVYRNYVVFGRFLPFGIQSGYNLYQGWHPESSGTQYTSSGKPFPPESVEVKDRIASVGDEWGKDHLLKEEAVRLAFESPSIWVKGRMWSLFFFWFPPGYICCEIPSHVVADPEWIKWWEIVLTIFAAVGMCRKRGVLLLPILTLWVFYGLTHTDIGLRYRFLIEPLLCLYAAGGIVSLYSPKFWRHQNTQPESILDQIP